MMTCDSSKLPINNRQTQGECMGDRMQHDICVFVASGEIQAQQVRGFLAAAGIESELRGEALRKTHGLTIDGLGMVEIVVSKEDEDQARALLASAERGAFRLDEDAPLQD